MRAAPPAGGLDDRLSLRTSQGRRRYGTPGTSRDTRLLRSVWGSGLALRLLTGSWAPLRGSFTWRSSRGGGGADCATQPEGGEGPRLTCYSQPCVSRELVHPVALVAHAPDQEPQRVRAPSPAQSPALGRGSFERGASSRGRAPSRLDEPIATPRCYRPRLAPVERRVAGLGTSASSALLAEGARRQYVGAVRATTPGITLDRGPTAPRAREESRSATLDCPA